VKAKAFYSHAEQALISSFSSREGGAAEHTASGRPFWRWSGW
jgi:hypothetical protein